MSHSIIRSQFLLASFLLSTSYGAGIELPLTGDDANSSPSAFGGSLAATLDDPFAYDPSDPISALPQQNYNVGNPGYHGSGNGGTAKVLSYTFAAPVTISGDDEDIVFDLYGRAEAECVPCIDRDDDIDIDIYNGDYLTPVASLTGITIDNSAAANAHFRAVFDELAIGLTFDRVQISANDTDTFPDHNYFTLLEIRSASIQPDTDTDNDGLPDFWEDLHSLSTTDDGSVDPNNGPDGDPDMDNLNNLAEFERGTDPNDDDSDGDTLKDGDEVTGAGSRPATDPTSADTDGDTLSDLVETNTGTFIDANDTGSNPTLTDSDMDNLADNDEVANGFDPNDPLSGLNLALGKTGGYFDATGTPTGAWNGLPATNVNDGNLATISHTLDMISTDYYYELDLGADTSISHVIITGRGFHSDCCTDRLEDQTLVILNSSGTEVHRQELPGQIIMSETFDLSAAQPFGQFVRIVNTSGAQYGPQLGELAVFGSSTPPAPPLITSIDADPITGNITLNWNSQPGASYSIFRSSDLIDFFEINDSVPSNGATSSVTFNEPEIIGKSRYFFRIHKN